ncbi:hypothetical protein OQ620_26765, partial [Klebsiella pneumoniae]|nr:hypothetical protein [Klebsiella pneumoniae]
SEEQISAQVSRTATADYDTGGKYQKVAQAVTAAMQGLAGGNLAQAASGAVSPYVAEIIHSQTTDSALLFPDAAAIAPHTACAIALPQKILPRQSSGL